jgi:hypothetical protein
VNVAISLAVTGYTRRQRNGYGSVAIDRDY